MNSIHLIDASIYVFRSYFSVATEFRDRDEAPVHAVFGFLNTMMGMLADSIDEFGADFLQQRKGGHAAIYKSTVFSLFGYLSSDDEVIVFL